MKKTGQTANYRKSRRNAAKCAAVIAGLAALFIVAGLIGCGDDKTDVTTIGDTGGRLQVKETYFDAGTARTGQNVEHSFEIRNTGTGPLQLGPLAVKRLEGC